MARKNDGSLLLTLTEQELETAWTIIEYAAEPVAARWWLRAIAALLLTAVALGAVQPGLMAAVIAWATQTLAL